MNLFPEVNWSNMRVRFDDSQVVYSPDSNIHAALVFPFYNGNLVLANIPGRGWTIPGGRLEAGESAENAAVREVYEETGAEIEAPRPIGYYTLFKEQLDTDEGEVQPRAAVRRVPTFVAKVVTGNPIPENSESLGSCAVSYAELPSKYYTWDPLIEAVCKHAFAQALLYGWLT